MNLAGALRLVPVLKRLTLFKCAVVWGKHDVFPTTPISMNRLEEFVVRTESPRHFVMVVRVRHLAIPDTARKRLAVRTLAAPKCSSWMTWLNALPPTLRTSYLGGCSTPYLGWTSARALPGEYYDDMARFCFEFE